MPEPLLRDRPESAKCMLRNGPGRELPRRGGRPSPPVVLAQDAGLTGRHQRVLGEDLAGPRDQDRDPPTRAGAGQDLHGRAEQPLGHRVASRPEPDAGELVDLPELPAAPEQPGRQQQRQPGQERPLDLAEPLRGTAAISDGRRC